MSKDSAQPNLSDGRHWLMLTAATAAAFGTYFCMYAFRKPFTVAEFEGVDTGVFDWEYKTLAVTSQVVGYMLSKFIGIKVLTELPPQRRAVCLIGLIVVAELALVGFGFVPAPWNLVCLFLNGLPLGMVFGLVLSFLEGRRQTEALAAGLCVSFILSDGVSKSVGKSLLDSGVSEFWMPAAVGGVFFVPLLLCVAALGRVKPPGARDIASRRQRTPMNSQDRLHFLKTHAVGLGPILVMFLLVTVVRSIRSDFAPEIWKGLGVETTPALFSNSEKWVGLAVTVINGAAVLVVDNRRAFRLALGICLLGFVVLLASALGQSSGAISPFLFMVFVGVGLYLPYVAVHTTVFERLVAMTREKGSLVFLMYVADALGYLGYVAVMTARQVGAGAEMDFTGFFRSVCLTTAIVSIACVMLSGLYFSRNSSLVSANADPRSS